VDSDKDGRSLVELSRSGGGAGGVIATPVSEFTVPHGRRLCGKLATSGGCEAGLVAWTVR
jgi:hypothetical protein